MKALSILIIFLCLVLMPTRSIGQLTTTASSNATTLANTLVGPGISVSGATLVCATGGSGTFSNGNTTNLGLDAGVMLASGLISNAIGPNDVQDKTTAFGTAGDADLTALSGFTTFDACNLEFDFEATANQVSISYIFGSEEYLEYVGSPFNDVFGFLVSGPNPAGGSYVNENIATVPVNVPVTINSINNVTNSAFYVDNPPAPGTTIQYDGFTVVLTASLLIVPCETYHFKLAIADASDEILDSGVFLEEASFTASLECQDIVLLLDDDGTGSITAEELVASDLDACDFTFSVSQSEFVCADEGENEVTVTADDGLGTVLTCEATVTVVVPDSILDIDFGPDCRTVYLGYGPNECTDIVVTVTGGTGPYTYEWSTGETTDSINVCPAVTTDYFVTVTDANGCTGVGGPITVLVVDVSCGNNDDKVLICHIPPGYPENASTLCVSAASVPAHLAHGDFLGDCSETADPCADEGGAFSINPQSYQPVADNDELILWPNPGDSDVSVIIPKSMEGLITVQLMSLEGAVVYSGTLKDRERSLTISDLSFLSKGVYYIRINDQTGQESLLKWFKTN